MSFHMNIESALKRIQPGRKIEGISAVLLPFNEQWQD